MRERVSTRNFRHPIMALPAGTRLESPTGMPCRIVGPSFQQPGRLVVAFETNDGEFVQHLWPASLRDFRPGAAQ